MSSPFSAVKPSGKLSDQVASALEAEICAGRVQAAQKLPTEAVRAQQLQVSRTVVREAISHLKSLIEPASLNLKCPFGLSLSKPRAALRQAQRERFK